MNSHKELLVWAVEMVKKNVIETGGMTTSNECVIKALAMLQNEITQGAFEYKESEERYLTANEILGILSEIPLLTDINVTGTIGACDYTDIIMNREEIEDYD